MLTGPFLSITTLNVNGLNAPNQKQRLADTKARPIYMLSTREPSQNKENIQSESEGLEKIFHANRDQK